MQGQVLYSMNSVFYITDKKEKFINQLIDELHENLARIDELEYMNVQKIFQINILRAEILRVNSSFRDNFQIALKDNFVKNNND